MIMLPHGLDYLPPEKVLITVILTTVYKTEHSFIKHTNLHLKRILVGLVTV